MAQDILIRPALGEPQITFTGSGTRDTPIYLNVVSSYQSASSSGTAVLFEGTEGQLFAITDNLSSGTIFSVGDITGLPILDIDATGVLSLARYGSGTRAYQTLELMPSGTGAGQTFPLKFYELTANGSNFVALKSPDNIASNVTWTLPSVVGTSGYSLTSDGTGNLLWASGSSGGSTYTAGSGLLLTGTTFHVSGINWAKKTSNYTALNSEKILADTSGGTWTLTLPATPTTGNFVEIMDGANFATTNLTVARNGSTIEGLTDDVLLDIKDCIYTFVYDGATWEISATVGPAGPAGPAGTVPNYSTYIGNNSATRFVVNHNLNISNVLVSVRESGTIGYFVYPDVIYSGVNNVVIDFVTAPTSGQYLATVLGMS